MWRIFGLVFFADKTHFVDEANKTFKLDELRTFLTEKGVGLYDTATAVNRTTGTAADKDLEVVEPTDLDALLLQVPACKLQYRRATQSRVVCDVSLSTRRSRNATLSHA